MIERCYWWDTVAAAGAAAAAIAPPSRVDVAIVGAGYTGLAAARVLARRGASVVVLERHTVGWGASSRNGGQVLAGMKLDPATLVARYGETRARELFQVSLDALAAVERLVADERIDCEYARVGHIQAAAKPSHFRAFAGEQALLARVFHHDVSLVAPADQHGELASDAYFGLLVDERSGALNPATYVRGLAAAAARAGATIVERTPVDRIDRHAGRWRIVTSAGEIDAGDVLVATNGYTDRALPWLQRRFIPVGSYIVVTEPLAAAEADALVPRRRMVFDSKHFLFYLRVLSDRRLLFGGRAQFSQPDEASTRWAAAILAAGITRVFPQLRSATVAYAWSGQVAFTRDQMPRAGRIDGVYYAGGYCGHGIAMATHLGALVAARMAGDASEHPLFDDRFAEIPLYNGNPWFLPAVGLYYRLRDFLA